MGMVARLLIVLIVVVVSWAGPGAGPAARPSTSHRTGRRARVVVYLQDVEEHLDDEQLRRVAELCKGHGYTPVAVVQERPGEAEGLVDALRMVRDGEADRIVMASRDLLPDLFESATGEHPPLFRELPAQQQRPARHRRTRPTRRGGAGA